MSAVQLMHQAGAVADGAEKQGVAHHDPDTLAEHAQQFEALFVSQLLASVREAGSGGWLGEEGDGASTTAIELAETQLAQAIAQAGGLGLGSLVLRQTETHPAPPASPSPECD